MSRVSNATNTGFFGLYVKRSDRQAVAERGGGLKKNWGALSSLLGGR
jgi:hypothetical protein